MARATGRTVPCTPASARTRLAQARSYLDLAEIAADGGAPADNNAAVSNAVNAGIAAADALTGLALGQRSRSQDHATATTLLGRVTPEGPALAKDLTRLLSVKDDAQYSDKILTTNDAAVAIRQATKLVTAANDRASRR